MTRSPTRPARPVCIQADFWNRADLSRPLADRDVAALFRAVLSAGVSQRSLARLTGQYQSEISEILAGRKVHAIHVLHRIADGLAIPRDRLGLSAGNDATVSNHECCDTCVTLPPVALHPGRLVRRPDRPRAPQTNPLPGRLCTTRVFRWTGVEVQQLRHAMRLSVRDFAAHLGVSDRMVSKWECGGHRMTPRQVNQAALDTCLARASADAQTRFADWPTRVRLATDQSHRWILHLGLTAPTLDCAVRLATKLLTVARQTSRQVDQEALISSEHTPLQGYKLVTRDATNPLIPSDRQPHTNGATGPAPRPADDQPGASPTQADRGAG